MVNFGKNDYFFAVNDQELNLVSVLCIGVATLVFYMKVHT